MPSSSGAKKAAENRNGGEDFLSQKPLRSVKHAENKEKEKVIVFSQPGSHGRF
jgi:hypothetical protein